MRGKLQHLISGFVIYSKPAYQLVNTTIYEDRERAEIYISKLEMNDPYKREGDFVIHQVSICEESDT
jgi:hypothetical protein